REVLLRPQAAPVQAGQPEGELIVRLEGREVGRASLVAAQDVARAGVGSLVWRVTRQAVDALFGREASSHFSDSGGRSRWPDLRILWLPGAWGWRAYPQRPRVWRCSATAGERARSS